MASEVVNPSREGVAMDICADVRSREEEAVAAYEA